MAYSYATLVSSGSTANVSVPFPYLERSHVHVKLDNVQVPDEDLTWTAPGIIQLPETPASGTVIKTYRLTDASELVTVYSTPNVLDHRDWNGVLTQMLYITQEAFDLGAGISDDIAAVLDYVNGAMAAAGESAGLAATSETNAAASEDAAAASAAAAAADAATVTGAVAAVIAARDAAIADVEAQEATSVAAVAAQGTTSIAAVSAQGTTSVAAVEAAETSALANITTEVAAAEDAADLAEEWADNDPNIAVTGNPGKYSAKHWAALAESIVGGTPNAAAIAFTPDGTIEATDVQAALVELDDDIQAVAMDVAAKAEDADVVHVTGAETVAGVKTFSDIPVGPASDPTTDNQLSRKKYVDDGLATKANLTAGLTTITADYTLVLGDAGKIVEASDAGDTSVTITVPPNSSVAFPIGTRIDLVNFDTDTVVAAGGGVTINSKAGYLKLDGTYAGATLYKRATNTWVLIGSLKS